MIAIPPLKNAAAPINPLIEGLGPLPATIPDLLNKLTPDAPVPTPEMRSLSQIERFIELGVIEDFYLPTASTVAVALRAMTNIVWGYKRRQPNAAYWLNHQKESAAMADQERPSSRRTSAPSFAVTGTSGTGKTTAVDMILGLFKIAVQHDQERYPLLPRIQVPTLKVTCPVNRTAGAFIDEFFVALAEATGIDYREGMSSRLSVEDRMIEMGRLARLHCVGLLAFDEVQNMVGGDDQLKRLLVRMTNTIKLPIIFVGTPKGWNEHRKELATARRMAGDVWTPFKADDPDWKDIMSALWEYQLTRTKTELDESLREKMDELTCGIPAIAKALFTFAQEHLIINAGPDDPEIITPPVLDFVFKDKMAKVAPAMKALRSGEGLEAFEDLLPEEWPKPASWEDNGKMADLLRGAFCSSAMSAARRGGKAFALSQITGENS